VATVVLALPALGTGHSYPSGNIACTHLYKGLNRLQDRNMAGRIMSMKSSCDPNGKQTREFRPAQYLNQLHHCVLPEFCFKIAPLA